MTLLVYVATLAPGLTFENSGTDGGDLIAAARTLGVPHPTGYPTYTLLAWLISNLPVGTVAYRVNLLSALCAALTVGLVCRSVQILLQTDRNRRLISAATALTLAFSTLIWSQAVISEVYALLALFSALIAWLLLRWRQGSGNGTLWLAGLILGLGLGNHLTLIFIVPAALVLLWPQRRQCFHFRVLLPAAGLFLLGLSIYAYLPLAARFRPPVNWGNPQTWKGFLWVVTADQYQPFVFGLPPEEMLSRAGAWAYMLGDQFIWLGLPIALIGAWWWWQHDRCLVVFSATWMIPLSVYAFLYDTGDSHVYLIPVTMLLAFWWGGGACYVLRLVPRYINDSPHAQFWKRLALLAVLLLPLISLVLHWGAVDLSDDWLAHAYAYQALDGVEPNSLIVVRGDRPTFALWYAVYAEGRRPDVAVVSGPLLAFIWYRDQVRHLYPYLILNEPRGTNDVTTDDLVRDLIIQNWTRQPVYATDPKETWDMWFDFVEQDAPIYRVQPKGRWEQGE